MPGQKVFRYDNVRVGEVNFGSVYVQAPNISKAWYALIEKLFSLGVSNIDRNYKETRLLTAGIPTYVGTPQGETL